MGSIWGSATVKAVITNCNYIGKVRYCMHTPERRLESEGKHEAIITEELYNAAQILIKKNAKAAPTKKPNDDNYFTNFLFCECGEKYYPHKTVYKNKKGKAISYSYMCRNRSQFGGCKSKAISLPKMETALIEYFNQCEDVFTTDSAEAARMEREKKTADAQIQNLRDKLQHLDKREKEVMKHYIDGEIDFDSYREMKKQLESDKNFIRAELAKYTVHEEENHPATITREEITANFTENWQGLTNAEKRLFLTNYIKKIIVKNTPIDGSWHGNTKILGIEFNQY